MNVIVIIAINLCYSLCSIHPRDKTTLANRLALAGKAVAYGQNNLHYQGPLPTLLTADNELNTLTIEFDGGEGSDNVIEIRGTFGFEVLA